MMRTESMLSLLMAVLMMISMAAPAHSQEAPAFLLPNFDTPDYECDGLRAALLQRQPSPGKDAYDVVLHDQGGAEFHGNLAGMVGWKAESTITVVGTLTINACKPEQGPPPIVITGNPLKFKVEMDGRLAYQDGSGTVAQGSVTTKLPVVAARAKAATKPAAPRPTQKPLTKPASQ